MERVNPMKSIRSFLLTLAGLTFVAITALFTASLGLAIAGIVSVLILGQWLSTVLTGGEARPVRVYARSRRTQRDDMRVWNDGKGTIIDM
ncbi:MAG: hypothetical protein RLZZ444_1280 [Pseudomonadota bacterium]